MLASENISIGRNVAIGEVVSIRDQNHKFTSTTGVRGQGVRVAAIEIGNNVWIGRGVYIDLEIRIEAGSIVTANSVVKGVYPSSVLIAGAPATVRRHSAAVGSYLSKE